MSVDVRSASSTANATAIRTRAPTTIPVSAGFEGARVHHPARLSLASMRSLLGFLDVDPVVDAADRPVVLAEQGDGEVEHLALIGRRPEIPLQQRAVEGEL